MGHTRRRASWSSEIAGRVPLRQPPLLRYALVAVVTSLLGARPVYAEECSTAICVGNPCTISTDHSLSDGCFLDFGPKTVIVTSVLSSAVDGGSFTIHAGNFTLRGKREALGGGEVSVDVTGDFVIEVVGGSQGQINVNSSGAVTITAGGNVVLGNDSNITALGKDDTVGGDLLVQAGGNITSAWNSSIIVDGNLGGDGGTVTLLAGGDASIDGTISADGTGAAAAAGIIIITPGVGRNLTVTHSLEANSGNTGLYDGEIKLGPACTVTIAGTVRTRNPQISGGGGVTAIEYTQSADLGYATLLADNDGGNRIFCRCFDSNNDRICDGGCVQSPTGLTQGTKTPAAVVTPSAMPPCGCGNGILDPGEDCDDGNSENADACRYNCKLPRCGDGTQDPGEQCDHASWNGTTADCCTSSCQLKAAGSSCSDSNVCTQTDQCNSSGTCVGSNPVTCTPLDQCHLAGTCNPVTGCSNPIKTNGSACNDSNTCTINDVCTNGLCGGSCNTGAVCGSSCGGSLHCQTSGGACVCQ